MNQYWKQRTHKVVDLYFNKRMSKILREIASVLRYSDGSDARKSAGYSIAANALANSDIDLSNPKIFPSEVKGIGKVMEDAVIFYRDNAYLDVASYCNTKRWPREAISPIVTELTKFIKGFTASWEDRSERNPLGEFLFCGSWRRTANTIGDLDILFEFSAGHDTTMSLWRVLLGYFRVAKKLWQGETKLSVMLDNGVQVDFLAIRPKRFGAAKLYFTGSADFNIQMRGVAKRLGYCLNEKGLYSTDCQSQSEQDIIASRTERDIFNALDLKYIEPRDRSSVKRRIFVRK